jgi:xanthine dehydrogenase accessory factor
MFDDLLKQAAALKSQSKPFAMATIVACKPPTSAKPGAKAIVQADGSFYGWVGGSCAQPLVTQQALKALRDGQPCLLILSPTPDELDFQMDGVTSVLMTCQSEGTLAIYLEPFLPRPQLLVIGQSPMARSLVALGETLGFSVCACDSAATRELFPDAEILVNELEQLKEWLASGASYGQQYVVVATMGHYDEEALEAVVGSQTRYIGLVASPRRGRTVIEYLHRKGVSDKALERVKYPAGLDIGATTPEEIALSILTEIVQKRRNQGETIPEERGQDSQATPLEAIDPVCQMTVQVAESRYNSTCNGDTFYFCCLRCKETFDQEPERYAVLGAG